MSLDGDRRLIESNIAKPLSVRTKLIQSEIHLA